MDQLLTIACFYFAYRFIKTTLFSVAISNWTLALWIEFILGILFIVVGVIRVMRLIKRDHAKKQSDNSSDDDLG